MFVMDKHKKAIFLIAVASLWGALILLSINLYQDMNFEKKHRLIGASYMTMNNEFYKIINEEISQKVEAEGDQMILRDPSLSVTRQIEQINEMLDMGIDVLILTPVDWSSLNSVLNRAKEQGVIIVVVDSNVKDEELVDCTITSDNYAAGYMVGEYFLKHHKNARLVMMTQYSAKSGQLRTEGFLDAIKKESGITVVSQIECDGQLEIAMPKMQQLITSNLEFDAVFCLNDLSAVGVVAALDEADLLDQVDVFGVDASPDSKALIKEHMMVATAAQFPSRIGKFAGDNIYKLLQGQPVSSQTYIPVELVTGYNVEHYGIERWQ